MLRPASRRANQQGASPRTSPYEPDDTAPLRRDPISYGPDPREYQPGPSPYGPPAPGPYGPPGPGSYGPPAPGPNDPPAPGRYGQDPYGRGPYGPGPYEPRPFQPGPYEPGLYEPAADDAYDADDSYDSDSSDGPGRRRLGAAAAGTPKHPRAGSAGCCGGPRYASSWS